MAETEADATDTGGGDSAGACRAYQHVGLRQHFRCEQRHNRRSPRTWTRQHVGAKTSWPLMGTSQMS